MVRKRSRATAKGNRPAGIAKARKARRGYFEERDATYRKAVRAVLRATHGHSVPHGSVREFCYQVIGHMWDHYSLVCSDQTIRRFLKRERLTDSGSSTAAPTAGRVHQESFEEYLSRVG